MIRICYVGDIHFFFLSRYDITRHSALKRKRAKGQSMSKQEQWQLSGTAAEIYERYLVPASFGP
jgi:hypothetical protein